jgi:uncharacterized protein
MKIIIDIGHPAHVHYFKNVAWHFESKGAQILFTCRNKEVVIELLRSYGFNFKCIGQPFKSIFGKISGGIIFNIRLLKIAYNFRPDIFLSAGSIYAAHIAFLLHRPHITLEDTFNMEQVHLYLPFSSAILTGDYEHTKLGKKEISYKGFQELTYLHPRYFKQNPSIKKELCLNDNERYFIVRFVSWNASHDIGHGGLSIEQKRELIELLLKYGKVFISSEKSLPPEFENYKFPLSPDRMHSALAFADIYIGEGATMASECAILGTKGIYINSEEAGTIDEQEKRGLVHHFRKGEGVIKIVQELLDSPVQKQQSIERSNKLVDEKIDVTSFLIWFIENWPSSFKIMKENPEYQERFK